MSPLRTLACAIALVLACDDEAKKSSDAPPVKTESSKAEAKAAKDRPRDKEPPAKKTADSAKEAPAETPPPVRAGSRAVPPHAAPKGTLGGRSFAPDVVMLIENSDGAKLLFSQRSPKRERWRCEEPLGDSEVEISIYRNIPDWTTAQPVDAVLTDFGGTSIGSGSNPPGKARITLTKKDAATFTLAGKLELASDDGTWKLAGDFVGEYCPTKGVERESPEPLSGMPWGLTAVSADAVPKEPLAAFIAGKSTRIAHVNAREVLHDGLRRTELIFFAEMPPDPCSPRPERTGLTSFADDGSIASRDVEPFRIDTLRIELADAPTAGARLAGLVNGNDPDARTQITDADLHVFETDGYRAWRYWQYFSAALAVDEVTDASIKARVYLALPDDGKSMLVGAFEAKRCPAVP
jgi:hypothetical protein